jgi:taurine transport system substrate-binding protein
MYKGERTMKKIWSKRLLSILVIGLLIMSGCTKEVNEDPDGNQIPEEINFGILRVPNDETIALAEGLFEKYFGSLGIKVNTIIFDSGTAANKAMASGSIDFATMGNVNAVVSLVSDLGAEMIWIHEALGDIEALAVKDGSGINEISDLVGKKIATPFASTAHYILLNVLKEAGIEDQVEILDMKTAEIVAAWERGDIDAAYTWQPSLGNLLENGKALITSADMAEKGFVTANVDIVRKEFSSKYPNLVVSFIAMMEEAGDIYRNDPVRASEIVAGELEIGQEDALEQMKGSIWLTPEELLGDNYLGTSSNPGRFASIMKDTGDFLVEQGSINSAPDQAAFNEFVNPYYIEQHVANKNN